MGEVPERIWMNPDVAETGGFADPAFRDDGDVEYVTAASRDEAVDERDAEITLLRAAGEAALYQLVILNGNWATETADGGGADWWRIDTSEAIAALKAALPVPLRENDHG